MNTNTITQPRMTDLGILKGARQILETSWCAFWAFHPDGVRHCALGSMYVMAGHYRPHWDYGWLIGLTDPSARALYPELRGAFAVRAENCACDEMDSFDLFPTVYVNNHLGREAILRVFDAAILDIEIRLSAESPQIEMAKQEAIA